MGIGVFSPLSSLTVLSAVARSTIIFFVLLLLTRIMGKQELGGLAPFAFAAAITIGSIASDPLVSGETTLSAATASMTVMTMLWMGLAYVALRSNYLKDILGSRPVTVVRNGRVDPRAMAGLHMSVDNLMSQLRLRGVADIADVEVAVMEPSGKLSVLQKSQASPLRPVDIDLPTPYRGPPAVLVIGGVIQTENLKAVGLDELWLTRELARVGIGNVSSTYLAVLNTQGKLVASPK